MTMRVSCAPHSIPGLLVFMLPVLRVVSANQGFCVVFLSAVVVIWDEAAASLSALFTGVYNQNILWDLHEATCVLAHIFMRGGLSGCLCVGLSSSDTTCSTYSHFRFQTFAVLCFQITNTPADWLFLTDAPSQVVTYQCLCCVPPRRCHPQHAAGSVASGGDGVEANPAPPHHCPRHLPAASGKSLHLEERVPGRDGEVSYGGGTRKSNRLEMINGSIFHNLSLISSWNWGNIATCLRKWPDNDKTKPVTCLTLRLLAGLLCTQYVTDSSNSALLTLSLCREMNLISVALLLFIATSTTTSTQTRPNGRRLQTPATLWFRNQVHHTNQVIQDLGPVERSRIRGNFRFTSGFSVLRSSSTSYHHGTVTYAEWFICSRAG